MTKYFQLQNAYFQIGTLERREIAHSLNIYGDSQIAMSVRSKFAVVPTFCFILVDVNYYAPLKVQARMSDYSNDLYCFHVRLISRAPHRI